MECKLHQSDEVKTDDIHRAASATFVSVQRQMALARSFIQAGKTIAFLQIHRIDQWQHQSCGQCAFERELFFSLGYGRCRTVARSLHEHKQSKRHLYKDPEGPEVQANHNKPKTTQTIKTTRTSPSQICVSSKQKTANQTHKGARAQTKTPTKRICQGTQRSYHCVTLKNMPKLIIHHDIQ